MKISLPMLVAVTLLLSACERAHQEQSAVANKIEAPVPDPPAAGKASEASIMRPEVAEEAVPPPPAAPPQPLRAVIGFPDGGAVLNEDAKATLDALLAQPAFRSGGKILLSGHSDSQGSDSDNLVVSRRRAEAVRDYLTAKGAPEERMNIVALGERRPIEPNAHPDGTDFEEGQARNRRVEILVAPPPSQETEEAPPAPEQK